ncbi:CoA pyrophosphatase [Paraburkholderia sp. Tr-20389]|uniref:CoA pyrophosphatase n=1 Tax=Paraburkholderia sp. Tr-20389 TaxID=2703903 RepID=UPI001981DD2E|nr:CoA pyrophosphatase [Paraburkholderia sp. Tr-20389]MBN3758967.1 CoA pyrophosphatase [Paraburkholderia sp. Tr-20389]
MTAPSRPSRPVFDPESLPVEPADLVLPAIAPDRLTPDGLRARFDRDLPWEQETREVRWRETADPRVAAVLVALVVREEGLTVLLTQRTAHLNDHAGQVSFPGGRHEPHDATTTATALREAQEEVGLDPSRVEVLGSLPEYLTGTGFRVTPVVGLVHPPFTVQADTFEVAEIFEVPLRFLMDPQNHEVRVLNWEGGNRRFFAMPYPRGTPDGTGGDYFIWGATAGMLRNFYRFLAA